LSVVRRGRRESAIGVLAVSERSRSGGTVQAFVAGMDERTRRITWTQHGHAHRQQMIEATFAIDAGQGRRLRDGASPCLSRNPH
jgi:hypothetical protein